MLFTLTYIMDSCATKLSAEVFQVKYNKTDGPTSQILGVRFGSNGYNDLCRMTCTISHMDEKSYYPLEA